MVILTNAYIIAAHCTTPDLGGGGGTQQSFTREGSVPGLAPYPFKPFLTEKDTPFVYLYN